MTIYKKKFTANPPKPENLKPAAPADHKRTFDARPKPTDRHGRVDPRTVSFHVDRAPSDPFDAADE